MCLLQRSVAADQAPRLQQLTAEVTNLRGHKREAGAARRRADLDKSQAQEALASVQAERQALQEDLAEARERKASGPQVRLLAAGSNNGVACRCCGQGRQAELHMMLGPEVRRLWWPALAPQRPLAVALAVGQFADAAVNATLH